MDFFTKVFSGIFAVVGLIWIAIISLILCFLMFGFSAGGYHYGFSVSQDRGIEIRSEKIKDSESQEKEGSRP